MIRFSTVAANADVIGDDTPMAEPQRKSGEQRHGPAGHERTGRDGVRRERDGTPASGAARPAQDINAPGFIKDQDVGKPA
jgi:hypothetical protein